MEQNLVYEERDVEYFVLRDKKVVVCKLHNCRDIALLRIDKYTYKIVDCLINPERYFINDVFVGVAKCSPEDEFDEVYGKKLALTKAKAKRGKAINNAITLFITDIGKVIDTLYLNGIHEIPDVESFINNKK